MPFYSGQIQLAAVGKMKTRHWLSAQQEYAGRIKRYVKFNLVEVKDVVGRGVPDGVAMVQEGEQLLKATAEFSRRIALTPDGKLYTSEAFSRLLRKELETYGRIAFLIGGPLGFSPEAMAACDRQVSLSPLTFTHELARVLFLEQLYRAFTIMRGEPYHK